MVKYFSVPADFNKETIDKYDALNRKYSDSRISETYGNLTMGNRFGCGRSISELPEVDFLALQDFIKYSRQKDIEFDYTLNTSHMMNREFTGEGVREIKQFLSDLYDSGVRRITAALPSVIDIIRSTGLDFEIKASAICSIDNANKALAFKKMGVSKIVTKELINRDFHRLRRIRKVFGEKVEIIVNTPCHMDCAYRMSHYNQQSSDSITSTNPTSFNYYEHKCMLRRYGDLGNWLKTCWVRPEDLKYYMQIGINYFKLQGRQAIKKGGDVVRVAECYFKEEFDGDLVDLINMFAPLNSFKLHIDNKKLEGFLKPFVEKDHFCVRDCTECDYCDAFAKKCVDPKEAEEISAAATRFYEEYDQYGRLLDSVQAKKKVAAGNVYQDDDEDFDL
jgi:collagenase-like PrtC family protease